MRQLLALASLALVAACGTPAKYPEIRAVAPQGGAVGASSPFDAAYQKGKEHLFANRFGLAIVSLEKALRIDPLSVAALNALGVAYDELRRPEVAKIYYFKALAIEPNSADTMNNIALSAALAGDDMTARQWFAQAVTLAPADAVIAANARRAHGETVTVLPDDAVVDDTRPSLERTGMAEVTLTLCAPIVEIRRLEHYLAAGPDAEVLSGIRRASAASGIDFGYLMAQAAQESGFRTDAKAATSSAAGLFQFVDGTWIDLMRRHGAKHGVSAGASRDELLGMRSDPRLSAAMAAEYAKENRAALEGALGRKAGAADLYFAHFLGAGGATKFLQALDAGGSVKAAELMPEAAAANRTVFYDRSGEAKTVQTIYRELSQKIEAFPPTFRVAGSIRR